MGDNLGHGNINKNNSKKLSLAFSQLRESLYIEWYLGKTFLFFRIERFVCVFQ